jgi:prophage regulatory protein
MSLSPASSQTLRIIGQREVCHLTSLSRAFIYKLMAAGQFPQTVPLAGNRVGWIEVQVLEWIAARVADAHGAREANRRPINP